MKMPKLFARRFRKKPAPTARPNQLTLKATATASRREEIEDYDRAEPTTSLSTAFIIVLVLHVVAVGGIYIFNSIKASRPRSAETAASKTPAKPANAAPKTVTQKPPVAHVEQAPVLAKPVTLPSGAQVHRVQPNENLTKIATDYGVTVAALEDANGIPRGALLRVDQQLNIPAQKTVVKIPVSTPTVPDLAPKKTADPIFAKFTPSTTTKPTAPTPAKPVPAKASAKTYTVDKGDTATFVARKFNVSVEDLLKINSVSDPKKLQPGKILKIPTKTN